MITIGVTIIITGAALIAGAIAGFFVGAIMSNIGEDPVFDDLGTRDDDA